MDALDQIINDLQEIHPLMIKLANPTTGSVGYFRPIQPDESMMSVMAEAEANGSIVASRGSVVCIMPKMVEGWQQIFGRRRSDALMVIRDHMEEVDEH